jgi:hypothetical protein
MKKQAEQKTKGHKISNNPGTITPVPVKTTNQLSKELIDSLKDKNAAKMKNKRKH